MNVAESKSVSIRLVSKPYGCRTGLVPLTIAVVVGWVFVSLWACVTVVTFTYNMYWSLVLAGSTGMFSVFLGFMTYTLVHDAHTTYVFEMTESEAVLFVTDKLLKCSSTRMVLLDDVAYAEYYPYRDSSCVILHSNYTQMEVPLWPLGVQGQDVIDFLIGRGVRVINVQSDDQFPD